MTEKKRKEIAFTLRKLLDRGWHRKEALLEVRRKFPADPDRPDKMLGQSTLYKYCRMYDVSTK